MTRHEQLIWAEKQAVHLSQLIESKEIIHAGASEKEINEAIYALAKEALGIEKYWHKRIVRSGKNTLLPYRENPPDLIVQSDDMIFLDFGPIFENWEADFGRTFVLGTDPAKKALADACITVWKKGKEFFDTHYHTLSCVDFYYFIQQCAKESGYQFGHVHCGHLIGEFPHEKIQGDDIQFYFHAENPRPVKRTGKDGLPLEWILEVHLIDPQLQLGGFVEQLVSIPGYQTPF